MTEVLATVTNLRKWLGARRAAGARIGFVPTMGALHDGHTSLMRRAASECDVAVASVFVNPLQFGPSEDLASYPRDLDRDVRLAGEAGVQMVFAPSVEEMYRGQRVLTTVAVAEISAPMEGASRPTHFAGVSTVVAKLFNLFGPCRAYFGEKDWQQLCVVRRMTSDLSFPVDVVGCPTVREADGLAMSSRNVYLDATQRAAAPVLRRALVAGAEAVTAGERDAAAVRSVMVAVVAGEPVVELDYAEVVDAATLAPVDPLAGELRLLIAARVGQPRLIDNIGVTVPVPS